MRVISEQKSARETTVALTDYDIQLILRGLLKDETRNERGPEAMDENVDVYTQFADLRHKLGIQPIR